MDPNIENVIIVGSGPAGYTAALYTARADLDPLVIEGFAWGGLLQQTTDVENFPGFPEGVMGPEMMQRFRDQAERFHARLETDEATAVELSSGGSPHKVWVGDQLHLAKTVVLAMGAEHRKLGVPGEEELSGRGVSYCATCDAAFFKDVPTIIVGGGDSAMEEAMFLAKFASKVIVVHRRDDFRASAIMLDRARAVPNIEFLTPYVVDAFVAGEAGPLAVARLRHTGDDSVRETSRSAAPSSPSATTPSRIWWPVRSISTTTATSRPSAARPGPTCPACSPPATWSTTPTARPSPPRAPAVRPPWTPSGTCATRRWTSARSPTPPAPRADHVRLLTSSP